MVALVWNQDPNPRYETGVDRGVFYPSNGPGVQWLGVTSVEESFTGGEVESLYFEGLKYFEAVGGRDFQARLTAISSPDALGEYVGEVEAVPGLILTGQPPRPFGFSYRTRLDTRGHKIHLVYNVLATPTKRNYSTLTNQPSAGLFEWQLDTVPMLVPGMRPSAHYIIDTTELDPQVLVWLEDIIYGHDDGDPRLPSPNEVSDFVANGHYWQVTFDASGKYPLSIPAVGAEDLMSIGLPSSGLMRVIPSGQLVETAIDGLYELE